MKETFLSVYKYVLRRIYMICCCRNDFIYKVMWTVLASGKIRKVGKYFFP